MWEKLKNWLHEHKWGWALVLGVPLIVFILIYKWYVASQSVSSSAAQSSGLSLGSGGVSDGGGGGADAGNSTDLSSLEAQETANQGLLTQLGTAISNLATQIGNMTSATTNTNTGGTNTNTGGTNTNTGGTNTNTGGTSASTQGNTLASAQALVQQGGTPLAAAEQLLGISTSNNGETVTQSGIANINTTGQLTNTSEVQAAGNLGEALDIDATQAAGDQSSVQNQLAGYINSIIGYGQQYNSATTSAGKAQAQQSAQQARQSVVGLLQTSPGWSSNQTTASNGATQLTISGPNGYNQTI